MLENLQLTFFSIGSLAVFIAGFAFFLFIFLLKERSRQTFYVSFSLLVLSLFQLCYFVSSTTYHPIGAFHRLGTILFAFMGSPAVISVFLAYQGEHGFEVRKKARILMVILYSIVIGVIFLFFFKVSSADRVFNFSGHFWDFDSQELSKQIGYLIVSYFLLYVGIGIWSIYRVSKRTKKIQYGHMLFLALWIFITMPAAILNVFSRDGLILRETFQIVTLSTAVIGMFFSITVYFNISQEKTRIIHRIIAIAFSSFLLIIQLLIQRTIEVSDISYNKLKQSEMQLYLHTEKKSRDLKYFGYFDFTTKQYYSILSPTEEPIFHSNNEVIEWKNSKIWYLLSKLKKDNHDELDRCFKIIQKEAHPKFVAYKNMIADILKRNEIVKEEKSILQIVDSYRLRIAYIRTKLKAIPVSDFRMQSAGFLKTTDKNFKPFAQTIQNLINNQNIEKSEILSYLSPFIPAEERKYRGNTHYQVGKKIPEHFVSFNYINIKSNRLYEAGFSYLEYRKTINSVASDAIFIILLFLLFVLLGFPLFFSNSLIVPIRRLADGFKEMNAGNLRYRVDVKSEDEVGFLTRSFNQMGESLETAHRRLQEYTEGLEIKVEERTSELNNTLVKVTKLKNQQDGDYFLTHLLTHPLSTNQVSSKKFEIEFLIRQRKRFSFRNYVSKDLGGDLNITSQIELYQKKYITFLNADGMGKSMQGAVGALVCGSVFSSIVDRTKNIKIFKNQYPEKWLKMAFVELHQVFKSFSGNMLVSCVMGLIEENTGVVYYINAEHPRVALYRKGKASFIAEQGGTLGKLGTLNIEEDFHIRIFRMQSHDVMLFGSDGKDELIIGKSKDGGRVINDEEDFFLEAIEKSDGSLKNIFKIICRYGKIMDDISLIKIKYTNNESPPNLFFARGSKLEALLHDAEKYFKEGDTRKAEDILNEIQSSKSKSNEKVPSKKLVRLMINLKEYKMALIEAEGCLEYRPDDNQILYFVAYVAKKLKKNLYAIDLSERLYMRNPNDIKNITQLAELHVVQKNYKRVAQMLEIIENVEPHNPKVKKFKSLLDSVGVRV